MPRQARLHFVSLKSSLVNLPISLFGPLLERNIRPQHVAVLLTATMPSPGLDRKKLQAYVGWTGMVSASSLAHFNSTSSDTFETVEIDPQYAEGLGFKEGDIVEVGLLHDLPTATSVATEPLTPDDWEILELHAEHVESTLLSQVRVAPSSQEVDVWVLGRTRIRLRVLSFEPSSAKAVLLANDTELSVAPKTRRQRNSEKKYPVIGETPVTKSDPAARSLVVGKPSHSVLLRVLPASVFPHHLPSLPDLASVAYVSDRMLNVARLEGLLPSDPNTPLIGDVKRLIPPTDPADSNSPPSDAPAVAKVLNPSDSMKREDVKEQPRNNHGVKVIGVDGVPEGQMIAVGEVDGVGDWDVVRLTISADSESPKLGRGIPSPISPKPRRLPPAHALAGVDDLLAKCYDFGRRLFALYEAGAVAGPSGLLVTGRAGAGKTSVVQATAKALEWDSGVQAFTLYVDVSRYTEKPVQTLRTQFQFWLDKAMWHRPSVLVFDNLEKLLGAELEHADSFRTRHLTETFLSVFSSASAHEVAPDLSGIVLIATAESQAALHPLLSATHLFKQVVHLKPPDKNARKQILAQVVQRRLETARNLEVDVERPLNFVALATETEGYSATDLQDLVARAVHQAAVRSSGNTGKVALTAADFKAAQVDFVPLSLRDVPLQKSTVEWADIGGLAETRRALRETLEWPTKYAAIFAQSPLRLRSGLLLYGYPGCGKTLLASAAAKECGLNFISIKGPELLNKYIGASEKSVRDIFERASAAKPCVLFFDEFDSIAPKRGHDSTGVTDRVVNQLLTLMDGAEGLDGVYVLAATSRPDLIDSALLRPGRLDKSLLCNMPTKEERKEILQVHARKVPMSPDVDFAYLADATEGFSGADLQALLYNAHLEVVHASVDEGSATSAAASNSTSKKDRIDDAPIEYTSFGGPAQKTVKSRAEQMAAQRRLRQIIASSQNRSSRAKTDETAVENRPKLEIRDEHLQRVLRNTRPSVSAEEIARLSQMQVPPPKFSRTPLLTARDLTPSLSFKICCIRFGSQRRTARSPRRGGRGPKGVSHVR
ncbi:P-loop containing nucleoside triphosphate hydrolase protein [Lactifluus subvellereus]|nr:P-loop containing nucleoside triphosphate hydrolase protein [Lactifluus subvellereus]